jgi:NitT/TauT family transport system permease protein
MVFLIAFFPIVIATVVGLADTEPELVHLVRSMGASGWQQFWKIRLPNALPSIFGGFKVSITLAVVGAVVAEFVGADQGLGYLILVANGMLDTRLALAAVVVLSLMGIALFIIVEQVGRYMLRNHGSS